MLEPVQAFKDNMSHRFHCLIITNMMGLNPPLYFHLWQQTQV